MRIRICPTQKNAINNPQQGTFLITETYHADEEPRLLSCATHTSVTNDADSETSGETSETDSETSTELGEPLGERHVCFDWWKKDV
jgi:hypothetical protein